MITNLNLYNFLIKKKNIIEYQTLILYNYNNYNNFKIENII
jgi:hypothetical protein